MEASKDTLQGLRPQLRKQLRNTISESQLNALLSSSIATGDVGTRPGTAYYSALEQYLQHSVQQSIASGATDSAILNLMCTQGLMQDELNDHAGAEQTWRQMLHLSTAKPELGDYAITAEHNLAFSLLKGGKHVEAEQLSLELQTVLDEKIGRDSPQALGGRRRMIEVVAKQGRYEEAKKLTGEGFGLVEGMGSGKFAGYQDDERQAMQDVNDQLGVWSGRAS